MSELQLLLDLYKDTSRQGPGGDAETQMAIELAGLNRDTLLKIADIGCGTGASTLTLARLLNADITAVDFLQEFLDVLESQSKTLGVEGKVTPVCASMDELPFEDEEFDVIWSEGAIYNIGFKKGVANWSRYLKPGGLLVVSEITWLTDDRPQDLQEYWESEYPEIGTTSEKINVLEKNGYSPVGYFVLPEHCWLDNYYEVVRSGIPAFLDRKGRSDAASMIVDEVHREFELYEKYKAYYSYGVYIARKTAV